MYSMLIPFTSLALVACAPSVGEQSGNFDCASCDNGADLRPIIGAETEWYRCWVDEDTEATDDFFREDYVFCELKDQARSLDVQYATVQIFTADNGASEIILNPNEPQVLVRKVNGPAYPLRIRTSTHLTNFDSAFSYAGITTDYAAEHVINRAELPTKDAPMLAYQPFDLWPIEVTVATRAASLRLDPYQVDLTGTGVSANDATTLDVSIRNQSSGRENDRMQFFIPITAGTSAAIFSGEGQFYRDTLPFEISGPGHYSADAEGLHPL